MSELTLPTQKLIHNYCLWHETLQPKEGVITIHVDEVVGRVARSYEKVREVVDWREEHLMRRISIERILKRRMFFRKEGKEAEETAELFVLELIRGGYFPNDRIPKSKIKEIREIMEKYDFLLENCPSLPKTKSAGEFYTQILGIAACEVEETLDGALYLKTNSLIEYMETLMRERIKIGKKALALNKITEEERNVQIYIAVQQGLFNLDPPIITYNLLKRRYPGWTTNDSSPIEEVTRNIYEILAKIEKDLSHPLADEFYKICERYDTSYLLLGDVISEDPAARGEEILDPKNLEKLVKKVYNRRLGRLKRRSLKAALFSTVSIFLTNVFALYVIEIPFTKYLLTQIKFTNLAAYIDVLAPTFLMALLVFTIRLPRKENFRLVLEEVKKIVYQGGRDVYEVEIYPARNFLTRMIIGLFYLASIIICFGGVFLALYRINYPPFSYLIMYIFMSLIAFTGTRIRARARELHVTEEKVSIFRFISDPFVIPVLHFGKWLSARWKKFNIVAIIFNFLIDTPALIFIEFLEQWRYFLKRKREAIH